MAASRFRRSAVFSTRRSLVIILTLLLPSLAWPEASPGAPSSDLFSMSLEDLMKVEVTSVSKTPERRFDAAAAIYVITAEDIQRSGVTSIPEALRLAPGVEVARIDANSWSVGIRGFGTRLARYTLVLIDGRAVYNPLFAGTYWEAQDVMLEDIDRIEVIRGPGGALWGSNAVNGVINIITKKAKETQGWLATAGGGTEEKDFTSIRYGGQAGDHTHYRIYGKYTDRGTTRNTSGEDFDDWQMSQAGFRTDSDLGEKDTLTVQGDAYAGTAGQFLIDPSRTFPFVTALEEDSNLSGANVLSRWSHNAGPDSHMAFQAYYDRTDRVDPDFREARDTVDLDFQHTFPATRRNVITYGTGFRVTADETSARWEDLKQFTPGSKTLNLYNVFAQDQILLVENRLTATIGTKLEHNDYTGWETSPNGRLSWTPTERQTLWGAVSRAVRTPSRVDRNPHIDFATVPTLPVPIFARYVPNEDFASEKVIAYETGYRIEPTDSWFGSVDAFYNDYDDLHSLNIGPTFVESDPPPTKLVFPFFFENRMKGHIYGTELDSVWNPVKRWRLEATYSYAKINLRRKDGGTDGVTEASIEGSSPQHEVTVRSSLDLPHHWQVDPTLRYVTKLRAEQIPQYWELDLHLGWHPVPAWEFAVVGQNLLAPRHPEFSATDELERGVYGKVTWRWD